MTSELPVTFGTTAERAIRHVDAGESVVEMARHTRELANAMLQRGNSCPTGEDEDPRDLECRMTHFVWADHAKHFLMLYRDVQLQLQIASLMVKEGRSDQAKVDALYRQSREALNDALQEWETDHAAELEALRRNDKQRKRQLNKWKLQHNPWPAYREQLNAIAGQSESLTEEYAALSKLSAGFQNLRSLLIEGIATSGLVMEQTQRRSEEIVAFIREGGIKTNPGTLVSKLDDYIAEERNLPRLDRFTNALTTIVAKFNDEQRVSVGSNQGRLRYKEVNFRRATDQWISAEVMPLLYELWELSGQNSNGLNVATVNVRNRALLLANELSADHDVVVNIDELAQPFVNFGRKNAERHQDYDRIRRQLETLIDDDLHLSSVYRAEPGFLPLALQSGINAFTHRQGKVLTSLQTWVGKHASGLSTFIGEAAREEKLSISERTVRVIRQRTVPADNSSYTNILMTKGYIGESFLVGREAETEHMRQLIENWHLGFRGAVVLTGNRLAGKTLFGEQITNRFFPGETIRLRPNASITVAGRRTTTSGNLAEALSFIEKYTVQQRPMVWIDDLENWWDKKITLAGNVRALGKHIDDYSARIFYLVATTNSVYRHLDKFLSFDRVFQSRIALDRFSLADMQRAIFIRHGATHRTMVDENGEQISEATFNGMVKRIYRATHGNVGETIDRWAYYTERYDEDRVYQPRERRYVLPPFLTPDTATLLTTLVLEKVTRDYRLRKLFGPAYQDRYGSILQRLIRVGIVTRNNDGTLQITESIVNDVGRMLEGDDYLNYGS